ncbi:MAG TPA: hypothetical protein VF113_12035 [Stellaceae bacterium]
MRKTILVAILAAIVVAGGGLYLAVLRPLLAVSDTVPLAEQALATPDAAVLAGINVKQAAFLERWLIGAPPGSPVRPASATPAGERSLFDHLEAARVDPRRDVDYVLAALYPSPAGAAAPGHAIVLAGRFDPEVINAYLAQTLHGTELATTQPLSYQITLTDPTSCKPSGSWVVTVAPGWILIADPPSHAALLWRLLHPAERADGGLDWWRSLARRDVLSIGLRNPAELESATAAPLLKAAVQGIQIKADAFERVYLGFRITAVPLAGQARLVIDAKDPARATEQITGWQHAIEQSRARWAAALPAMAALYDSLTLRSEGARNTIQVTVDRATIANAQHVANEVMSAVLGGFGVDVKTQPISAEPERVDRNPAKFEAVATSAQLTPYDQSATFAEKVDRVEGPFGVRLDEIRLGAAPDAGLDLVVAAFANAIPNVTGDGGRARLFVDGVKSRDGQELLRHEECGRDRNSEPASFGSMSPPRLQATKTLHLAAGADVHSIERIDGHVVLRWPTRTETIRIAHPAIDTRIEKDGVAVGITKVAGGSLGYEVSGERDRLLALRALNAGGQPLDRTMMVSTDFLFGDGRTVQSDYAGKIDAVELVLAAEEHELTYRFALDDLSLAGDTRASAMQDEAPEFLPYGEEALRRDFVVPGKGHRATWRTLPPLDKPEPHLAAAQLEPFELSLDKAQSFFALRLDFGVRTPDAPDFRRRFNFGQLRLTRLELKDGSVLTPPAAGEQETEKRAWQPKWSSPIRFMLTPKQGVLATSADLLIDSKAKPEELRAVSGALDVRFPLKLEALRLDDLSVGQSAQRQDLTVTLVARSRRSLTFEVNQGGDRVVYIRLLNAQGEAVAFLGPQITDRPDGSTRFELSPLNPAARAEIVLASEIESRSLPFAFTLP